MVAPTATSDPLFATVPQAPLLSDRVPVVVVGLPRSGSSLLSHILSQAPDWYVFDDLYTSREAAAVGASATKPLTRAQFEALLVFLGWQIHARLKFSDYAKPSCTMAEIDPMKDALRACFADALPTWPQLQEEWMARLALRAGATRWGWKQPGAFRMLGTLEKAYPGLKVIYLMRRPESVLASYKHMDPSNQDGDPDQYHPIAHSYYWRYAARSWLQAQRAKRPRHHFLRFEDMTADPESTGQVLGTFLGCTLEGVTLPAKPNSSFAGGVSKGRTRTGLTGLELRILKSIAGRERAGLFPQTPFPEARPHPADLWDLLKRSFIFTRYRTKKLLQRVKVRIATALK